MMDDLFSDSGMKIMEKLRNESLTMADVDRHPEWRKAIMAGLKNGCLVFVGGGRMARVQGIPLEPLPKLGRNTSCPCGSGRKYKQCCGET